MRTCSILPRATTGTSRCGRGGAHSHCDRRGGGSLPAARRPPWARTLIRRCSPISCRCDLPMRLGRLNMWHASFLDFPSRCVVRYLHGLRRLPRCGTHPRPVPGTPEPRSPRCSRCKRTGCPPPGRCGADQLRLVGRGTLQEVGHQPDGKEADRTEVALEVLPFRANAQRGSARRGSVDDEISAFVSNQCAAIPSIMLLRRSLDDVKALIAELPTVGAVAGSHFALRQTTGGTSYLPTRGKKMATARRAACLGVD